MSGYNESESINNRKKDENNLSKLYMELGKAYYEGAFEDPLPQLLPLFDKITRVKRQRAVHAAKQTVGVMRAGISNNSQKIEKCPRCGYLLEADAVFCGSCGYKI